MTKLLIDGVEVDVAPEMSLLEAVELAGQQVPRFCYHPRLSVAGNCRMCLVDVVGEPKLVASCSRAVRDIRPGQDGAPAVIDTMSEKVATARANVMEFLLINHPLDCPICDQGGECDLQDQAMAYGHGDKRYDENKRAVEEKALGPLVKTMMNRCIHCTRCVRFMTEVAGVEELGATGRGESMEIMTYLESGLSSEMQGNIADLCPVGALTHAPSAFSARAWEYDKVESIDVMDGLGSNITLDSRGERVMRITPRVNEAVNAEWISDKTRHVVDGLATQRLDQPYIREDGKLRPASWQEALDLVASKLNEAPANKVAGLVGDLAGVEEGFALKTLLGGLGVKSLDGRAAKTPLSAVLGRGAYVFGAGLMAVHEADAILLIGTNPRQEASVLNSQIRQRWLRSDLKVGMIGGAQGLDLTYPYAWLGAGVDTLSDLLAGKHSFAKILKRAKKPLIILGEGAVEAAPLAAMLADQAGALGDDWNGFAVLHASASSVGNLEIGLNPAKGGKNRTAILKAAGSSRLDVLYLLGFDEISEAEAAKPFVIYQGSHGDQGAHLADVILPGAAYTEKTATYVNTEGRVQMARRAVFPPGQAREDWTILRALSASLGKPLGFNTLEQLRAALYAEHPDLAALDQTLPSSTEDVRRLAAEPADLKAGTVFTPSVSNLYRSNVIARASRKLAEADAFRSALQAKETGTHG